MHDDINILKKAVRLNCDISDARYSGNYSVCNLALRLRDLYKWEKGLAPWEERDSNIILNWIGQREETWGNLSENNYTPLHFKNHTFDPFDTVAINLALKPYNLIYGAGYAHGLKPTFFLAECDETLLKNGTTVHLLGQELARDLLTLPALTQNHAILLRKSCARLFLWDQILYLRKSARPAMAFALSALDIDDSNLQSVRKRFEDVFLAQKSTYIHHELGEINDTIFNHDTWREVIAAFPQSPVELTARAVKDMLADTNPNGTLPHIVKKRNKAALGFYVAFLGNLSCMLFPDLARTFQEFTRTGHWRLMDKAISNCREIARQYSEFITDTYLKGKAEGKLTWAKEKIESCFIKKLKPGSNN